MTITHTVEQIASLGLSAAAPDTIVVEGNDSAQMVSQLSAHRILGMFVSGVESGAIECDSAIADDVIAAHDAVMGQTMRIEIAAVEVSRLLTDAGVDHRLLKGAALAHTIASNPAERSFRDVDVLVPARWMAKAVAAVSGVGAQRLQPELRAGYDERFAKSVTMRLDDVEIDLHRVLSPGPFGVWMKPDDLFLLKRSVVIGGAEIPSLDRTDHLVHACYHAALGQVDPVLANLRDVALLAKEYDHERFDETVARWKGRAVIRRAIGLVTARLDVELPQALSRYLHEPVDAGELAAIDPYLTNDPSGRFAALAPSTLRALPLADRPAYALAVGLPDGTSPLDRVTSLVKRQR